MQINKGDTVPIYIIRYAYKVNYTIITRIIIIFSTYTTNHANTSPVVCLIWHMLQIYSWTLTKDLFVKRTFWVRHKFEVLQTRFGKKKKMTYDIRQGPLEILW